MSCGNFNWSLNFVSIHLPISHPKKEILLRYKFRTGSGPEVEAPVFTGSVFQKGVEGRRGNNTRIDLSSCTGSLDKSGFVEVTELKYWTPGHKLPVPGSLVPVLPVTGTVSGNGTLTPNKGSDSPNGNKVRNGTSKPVFRTPVGLRRWGVAVTVGSGRMVVTNVTPMHCGNLKL
ncbi:hypothetical protein EDD15DRAFT_2191487 [Pisolithus albus]|nr:hypothetical protein EDD15DRAFT_2191487 [Pisolithus albus]